MAGIKAFTTHRNESQESSYDNKPMGCAGKYFLLFSEIYQIMHNMLFIEMV